MSQYIHITAKSKKDNDTTICLAWWGTSIARSDEMTEAFPYNEEDRIIYYEDFCNRVRTIEKVLEEKQEYITKLGAEKLELVDMLNKCESKSVAETILEHIDDKSLSIEEAKEDFEQWANIVTTIEIIKDIYEDNKDNWDIYYSNC